jgi:steroid delta-isomerase-like uncharacterized protein
MSDASTTETRPLDGESARELIERFYGLMNERHVRNIPKMFTEDIEFQDDAWPVTMRGHADVERFFRALWRATPDLTFEVIEGPYVADDGLHAAARVRAAGTVTGTLDPPGFAPTDDPVVVEFAAFYEFEGGRVRRERVIVNMHDLAIQFGAAPPPGSRAERLSVALQRLAAGRRRRRSKR